MRRFMRTNVWILLLLAASTVSVWGAETKSPADKAAEEKKKAKQEEKNAYYRQILSELERSNHPPTLKQCTDVLRQEFPDSREVLAEGVRRGSPKVAMFCIKVLGESGDEEDMKLIATGLSHSKNAVRLAAVTALRFFGVRALPYMESYILGERVKNVRKMAVKTVRDTRDIKAVPLLVRLLEKEQDAGVRRMTVSALQRLTREKIGDDIDAWQEYVRELHDEGRQEELQKYSETLRNKKKAETKERGVR